MGAPLPPILNNQDGPLYLNPYKGTYTKSRSYGLRMQRAYARGQTQSEARGHQVTPGGPSESELRKQRWLERNGVPLWRTDVYNFWRRNSSVINQINDRVSPQAQITPLSIAQLAENWGRFGGDSYQPDARTWQRWATRRLGERLDDIISYQDLGETGNGSYHFQFRSGVAPIEFWWYH